MQLYSFFRSGSSHRMRIALNLKGIATTYRAVDLRSDEHEKSFYKSINPQGFVPALTLDDGTTLIQSTSQPTAILTVAPCRRGRPSRGQIH